MVLAGIIFCLSQSALLSGLTIGLFGLSRLRLEVQAEAGDTKARNILKIRKDSNFLLATLLWGNVSVNVLLTLLTESLLAGIGAFFFSTIGITIFGEIIPQAYLSRHAAKAAPFLIPIIRVYQIIFYPVAKVTSLLLDAWLGKESIDYFKEDEVKVLLKKHALATSSDVERVEARGAINFLSVDDIRVQDEGEPVDPQSVIQLPLAEGFPVFPDFKKDPKDPFLKKVQASRKKWVVLTNPEGEPLFVMSANRFLRDALYGKAPANPLAYCHRPLVVKQAEAKLGEVINRLKVFKEHPEDDVVDHDLILYWSENKKQIVTGTDLLGRLLRGIVRER